MKKKPPYNQEAAIRGALRRAFSRSPMVREVLEESRQEFPRYKKDGTRHKKNWVKRQCQVCDQWVGSSKIAVDHIDPVISVERGKQDWNEYIDRLWCAKENLQRICDDCHDKKTAKERFERMFRNELIDISHLPTGKEERKDKLRKYTPKRLAKYPYPQDFIDQIRNLRKSVGLKV